MDATKNLPKYQAMIRGYANAAARMYRLDPDDVFQEACLIYVEACASFDSDRATFSTYLGSRLRKLNGRLLAIRKELAYRRRCVRVDSVDVFPRNLFRGDEDFEVLLSMAEDLSPDAIEVLIWILSGEWEKHIRRIGVEYRRPFKKWAVLDFGIDRHWAADRTRTAWTEIAGWWPGVQTAVA